MSAPVRLCGETPRGRGVGAAMGSRLMAVICFILAPATGSWRIITENSPIEALLGEDVTLPCLLSGISTPLNLQIVGVYWTRKSLNGTVYKVYWFESFNHTKFRPGSNINDGDLLKGNASLYIPRVQISDEGEYRCRVVVTPDDGVATYPLLVSGKPQVVLTDSVSVVLGSEISVTCKLTQFYPKAVTIRWVKHNKLSNTRSSLDGDTYFTVPAENSDGTFNVTSLLTVRPSSTEETGDEYSCIVNHRSLKTDTERNFTLTVEGGRDPLNFRLSVISLGILCPCFLLLGILPLWKPHKFTVTEVQRRIYTTHAMMFAILKYYIDAKPEDLWVSIYLKRRNEARLILPCDHKDQRAQYSAAPESQDGIPLNVSLPPMRMTVKIEGCGNSCICSIKITADADTDDGAELTLEFKHCKTARPISIHQTLSVQKSELSQLIH